MDLGLWHDCIHAVGGTETHVSFRGIIRTLKYACNLQPVLGFYRFVSILMVLHQDHGALSKQKQKAAE